MLKLLRKGTVNLLLHSMIKAVRAPAQNQGAGTQTAALKACHTCATMVSAGFLESCHRSYIYFISHRYLFIQIYELQENHFESKPLFSVIYIMHFI